MIFMHIQNFGQCMDISFVDNTIIPVCHKLRRKSNRVFNGLAKDWKETKA